MALNIVEKIDGNVKIQNVLISLSDKTGLEKFVKSLLEINQDVTFYSTGGTYKAIEELIGTKNLVAVSEYTGQPEMQGGLVKTLDFKIYMGLLGETYNEGHRNDLDRIGGIDFDLVAVNLYPFSKTVSQDGVTVEMGRTNIDIGGPCMLRASAKNFLRVLSLCNPADYDAVISELKANEGYISLETRFAMAEKTFAHTAEYDRNIFEFFKKSSAAEMKKCYREEK
ncbi:phosphoribosylaminoimidazolecarboxamide formyltransferase/IMP cyclohydrolase [Spirochaeta isovalerica]|uniref:Phosphoribosylaminoimidazolecarboxamide formyltransferase/IMP cyclohydrolase n=1 Tax=Spirochaeta isovalerica TaxID=150 RepID=A0A841R3W0_9SPIO|nr:phosphoribosylaminoimidazolecarboxamide formyltransferase/IMP cyclohydrolase [Spirochaeta isovalerica]